MKQAKLYKGGKTVSLINGTGNTGQLHAKKKKNSLTPYTKINSKWTKDLNMRLNTTKSQRRIQAEYSDTNLNKIFF